MKTNDETDQFEEVGKELKTFERNIRGSEKQISENFQKIVKRVFGGSVEFRMKKQHLCDETGHYDWIWADILIMIDDEIEFRNGSFFGWADTLRVSTQGELLILSQGVHDVRQYDLSEGNICITDMEGNWDIEKPTDQQIVENMKELTKQLLAALGKRVDRCKKEKEQLKKYLSVC